MSEKAKFKFYFELANRLFRAMVYGIFLYPLFVAGTETFHWPVFRFLNFETMKGMGLVFMIATIAFFPLSHMTEGYFVRGSRGAALLGKKLLTAEIVNMALSETITLFGLIIYITSANLKFFYLFFIISFIHLITVRPSGKRWQRRLDKISSEED